MQPIRPIRPSRPQATARFFTRRTSRRAALRQIGGGAALAAFGGGMSGDVFAGPAMAAQTPQAAEPSRFAYRLGASEPLRFDGGLARVVTAREFPALTGMSIRAEEFDPGALQASHWHPNADELLYVAGGEAEICLVGPDGARESFAIGAGDLAFFPMNWIHSIASAGPDPLETIVYLGHAAPARIDLSDIVGFLPRAVTAASLGLDSDALDGLPGRTGVVVAAAPGGG